MPYKPSQKTTRMESAILAILRYFAEGAGSLNVYAAMGITSQCHTTANATLRKMVAQGYCLVEHECKPAIFHVSPPVKMKLEAGETVTPGEAKRLTDAHHAAITEQLKRERSNHQAGISRSAAKREKWFEMEQMGA